MNNIEKGVSPKEELNPLVVNNLLAKFQDWNLEAWNILIKLTEKNLKEGRRELAEPTIIQSYLHAMLENRAKRENPRLMPFVDLFWQRASSDILDAGFERVFLGQQIRGKHLEVGEGTPAILGSGSPALLPYRSPPTSYMLIFDRKTDQLQTMQRFAAVVNGNVSIIDVYSDPRSPAIIPMEFLSDIDDPKEKAKIASRVSSEAGSGVEFNTGKRKKTSSFDELLKMKLTDLYYPEDSDEVNRYLRIMKYVEEQNKIKILGEVPLPELGSLDRRNNKKRIPVYNALDSQPIYLDWDKFFDAVESHSAKK